MYKEYEPYISLESESRKSFILGLSPSKFFGRSSVTASFLTHDETSRFAVFVFYTWRKRIFIHGSTLLVVETYEMGLGATGLSPNKVDR